ncbi:hypothetical protein ZIOFF_025441 [Zingiber officinale]|uniref:SAP30-binding protein n=1 Tax=Zingiber officinale TaxID=94328 RepID=A0A8J5GU23_ZINOF|nr:hypothetical protein ZIOFF_025441 [Zingiber officinale]
MASGSRGIDLLALYNDDEDEDEMDEDQVPPVAEAQSETVTRTMEIDVASSAEASSTEREKNNQLSSFTSQPSAECLKDTQERVNKYLGNFFNVVQNLDQIGKDVLDPNGYVKSGHVEEKIDGRTPGALALRTSTTQLDPLQPSDLSGQPSVIGVPHVEAALTSSMEGKKDDSLSRFLPPAPSAECPKELQERFKKFLAYKRAGKSFNAELRGRKDYRNPDFLQHAVRYQDIDEIGTCFSKEVFDPHGYDKSDYVDEIENDMRRAMERKEQERKKRQSVEFVSGGIQPGAGVPTPILSTQNSGKSSRLQLTKKWKSWCICDVISGCRLWLLLFLNHVTLSSTSVAPLSVAAANVLPSVPTIDSSMKDIRLNEKTKWDKIDGDFQSSTLLVGHDNPSRSHAALLSAVNTDAEYTAYV